MRIDLREKVMVRAVFMLRPSGKLERGWTWREIEAGEGPTFLRGAPPAWLKNPKRQWGHPQDPITFTGTVRPGHEAEAREALGL